MTDRIDLDQVRAIIRLAEETGVADLEVETPALKVRVRRVPAAGAGPQTPEEVTRIIPWPASGTPPASSAPAAPHAPATDDHLVPIVAPMVGTFYRAPSPDAQPFIKEGDQVDEGQVVCIIEAMKLFNEIQAEARGRVARVLVENATPVEYGQPLFLLDSAVRS
ncbi:MAG: acetyl-CoA carboxylase biotin carboxyl carrier protein [Candidatus Rokuibacteriota bacterium]